MQMFEEEYKLKLVLYKVKSARLQI